MEPTTILLFVILFCLSAFFSGTELALMGLSKHKVTSFFKQKRVGSKSLKSIKKKNDRLLITILIGNNLVNVYTASLATTIAISLAEQSGLEQASAVGISTGIITFLLLLFGEIVPKSFATKNAGTISLLVAPIYKYLIILLMPIILFIELVIRLFNIKEKLEQITDEEIESFIDMGKTSGTLEDHEHERIKNMLDFSDTTVEEIMTPRVKMDAISQNMTVKDTLAFYKLHTHSRIPIYKKTIDKIDNFITIRDIISSHEDTKLKDLKLQRVIKVPLNQTIDKLLKTFQKSRKHIATVIDEYGGVAGIVTLEDIIEEIFGEIRDETDIEMDEIKEVGNDYVIKSNVTIDNILSKIGLSFTNIGIDQKEFSGENVSYLITHILSRFPNPGEDLIFKIKDSNEIYTGKNLVLKVLFVKDGEIGDIEVIKK